MPNASDVMVHGRNDLIVKSNELIKAKAGECGINITTCTAKVFYADEFAVEKLKVW